MQVLGSFMFRCKQKDAERQDCITDVEFSDLASQEVSPSAKILADIVQDTIATKEQF